MSDVIDAGCVLEITRHFKASPERVFDAWTDAEALALWFRPGATMTARVDDLDVRVGGAFRIVISGEEDHAVEGVYSVVDRPNRLVFSWVWQQGDLAGLETEVDVVFEADAAGTQMTLHHRRLPTDSAVAAHEDGWSGALAQLQSHTES